jgi:hypothetical protein
VKILAPVNSDKHPGSKFNRPGRFHAVVRQPRLAASISGLTGCLVLFDG